jgi:ankyrin repeat protein
MTTLLTRNSLKNFKNEDIPRAIRDDDYLSLSKLINKNNVNAIIDNTTSFTALHYAIKFDNKNIIDLLLNTGANPYLKTIDGTDAYDLSLKYQTNNVFLHTFNQKDITNNNLKIVNSSLEKKVSEIESLNKYYLKKMDEVGAKSNSLRNENSELKKDVNFLTSENKLIKVELDKKNSKINLLEKEVDKRDSEISLGKRKYDDLKRKCDDLDNSYNNMLNMNKRKNNFNN